MQKIKIKSISSQKKTKLKRLCLANSKWFLKQAHIQFKAQNFNLATFFAIISYEECLKVGLFNSLEMKLITADNFNEFWGSHDLKLLSKYAVVQVLVDDKKIIQKLIMPKKILWMQKELRKLKKIENMLYI